MHAEQAYLFRHALMRDAAYQLQLPGERAKLHALAFEIIEQLHGGRAPEPPPLAPLDDFEIPPHATDAVATELAMHALSSEEAHADAAVLYLTRAAKGAIKRYRNEEARECLEKLALRLDGAQRSAAWMHAGTLACRAGHTEAGLTLLDRAVAEAKAAGNAPMLCVALKNLGVWCRELGNTRKAISLVEESMILSTSVDDKRLHANLLMDFTAAKMRFESVEVAAQQFRQVIQTAHELGDVRTEVVARGNLFAALYYAEDFVQAEREMTTALQLAETQGDVQAQANLHGNFAQLMRRTNRREMAEKELETSLALRRRMGDVPGQGIVLGNLAALHMSLQRLESAGQLFEQAIAIHRECGNRAHLGNHLCGYGLLKLTRGDFVGARETWLEGAALMRECLMERELEREKHTMREFCKVRGVPPFDEGDKK